MPPANSATASTHSQPGTKKKMEYWEPSFYLFAGGMLLAALAYPFLPNTDITDWARDEAEERMAMRARGETVEYGVNYAGFRGAGAVYMHDRPGSLPRPVTPADLATDDE